MSAFLEGIQRKGVPRLSCQDPLAEPLKRPTRIGLIPYPAYLSTDVPAWIDTDPNDKNIKNADTNQTHILITNSLLPLD